MKATNILMAALLTCAFTPAMADDMGFEDEPQGERRIVTRTGEGVQFRTRELAALHPLAGLAGLGGLGNGMFVQMHAPRMIKNAPYSADMVSERIQTLGDGNQIVRKTTSMSYRDSSGRTRTEVRNDEGEVVTVTIHDPVEGAHYVLRPRDKSAIKIARNGDLAGMREHARAASAEARAKIEELRREGKLPVRERFIVKQVERTGERTGEGDVQIRIAQVAAEGAAARVAPMIAGALGDHKWAAKAETKDLGTREFNGVKATGIQRSYEIPAGEIGNRNAIVVSAETWTSPDLQAVVYQKRSDPRTGESVFRLENLKRDEPAPGLFTVPADYTVKNPIAQAKAAAEKAAAAAAKAGQ